MQNYLNQLISFFKTYGKKLTLNKGDYLYKSGKKDNNLYLILKGDGQGQKNQKPIFKIYGPEISGEKSFLEKEGKDIDLLITSKHAEIYMLTPKIFEKLDQNKKTEFLKILNLYISSRVYKLNAVLELIKQINSISITEKFNLSVIKNLLNIDNIIILKQINGDLIFINGDFFPTEEITNLINKEDKNIKIGKNYITIKLKDYIIFGTISKNFDKYIISNSLLYSQGTLKYICHVLEQIKNKKLENTIKTEVF